MTAPAPTGIRNFRQLGGLPTSDGRVVRDGVLFRSGHLATATDDDLAALTVLGITTVVDLRTDHDIEVDGGVRTPDGSRYLHLPIGDLGADSEQGRAAAGFRQALFEGDAATVAERFGDGRAEAMVINGQRMFVEQPQAVDAARAYLRLAGDRGAHGVLLHCSAGKDRTGWLCTTLLHALGVTGEAIEAHYLESDAGGLALQRLATLIGDRGIDPEHLLPFLEVRTAYLEAGYAVVAERYGSMDGYLAALGVDDGYRRQLQDLLLVDA